MSISDMSVSYDMLACGFWDCRHIQWYWHLRFRKCHFACDMLAYRFGDCRKHYMNSSFRFRESQFPMACCHAELGHAMNIPWYWLVTLGTVIFRWHVGHWCWGRRKHNRTWTWNWEMVNPYDIVTFDIWIDAMVLTLRCWGSQFGSCFVVFLCCIADI